MYVERDIREHFEKLHSVSKMIALVGARQSGKTTFLKEHARNFNSNYVMFDDPDAREMFDEDIKKFEMQYVAGHELTVLDEVQYCKDAGKKLKYLVDSNHKLWVTSSSEVILGKEVLSYLVGRVSVLRLYPFSLNEFLRAKGQRALSEKIIERSVWEHMTYGGYPQVVLTDSLEIKQVILKSLYETMLLKDVARTFSIDDIGALERCARYFSETVGGVLSYNGASNALNISYPTLKKYIDALEKSYLIVQVKPFYTNKVKEITKQPKIYFLDTGMRNVIANRFDPKSSGSLFENYVLSELLKMGHTTKYWRTKSKAEVDFVLEIGGNIIPVEVKLKPDIRHVTRSMRAFIDSYKSKVAIVVSYKPCKETLQVGDCRLMFTDVIGLRTLLQKIKD
ncbi:MAG: ATP-binding protein [Candidatus Thermoplasmatota archaeon]|nr:ATP-binding protein [Euryarchaeota archaeon]MBU4032768.1 ATP-binding protein [Candidatus Thermoplasmatota archaeon]MBU4072220.1 ATP-binding protein [Candidatus Thermoplasmatota archaeon]MBU4143967.1 ATP-binding protein [Candidatus Thermoplasmatota archaeon]MBU4591919.1 ATP-binding protein [Candidatus Thermoplasmatota archaeon]